MILPDLEPQPSAVEHMFYTVAEYLCVEEDDVLKPQNRALELDMRMKKITQEDYNSEKKEIEAAMQELRDKRRRLVKDLPSTLREGAYCFFNLLPYIREAVSGIKNKQPDVFVESPKGAHDLTDTFRQALLIGARGTGFALRARVENDGIVVASPFMELVDVVVRVPETQK